MIRFLTCFFLLIIITVEKKPYFATTSARLERPEGSTRRVNKVVLGKRKVVKTKFCNFILIVLFSLQFD